MLPGQIIYYVCVCFGLSTYSYKLCSTVHQCYEKFDIVDSILKYHSGRGEGGGGGGGIIILNLRLRGKYLLSSLYGYHLNAKK